MFKNGYTIVDFLGTNLSKPSMNQEALWKSKIICEYTKSCIIPKPRVKTQNLHLGSFMITTVCIIFIICVSLTILWSI